MRQPASPTDSVSMPAFSTSLSSQAYGLSKLEVPSYVNNAVDPVSATEANLDQAFAKMSVS